MLNYLFLLLPIIVFFLIFVPVNFNLGLRHMLPIVPFMFVFSSQIINYKNNILKTIIILLLGWYIVSALLIMPNYMAYFNEFVSMKNWT